jgi:hypothetical protein
MVIVSGRARLCSGRHGVPQDAEGVFPPHARGVPEGGGGERATPPPHHFHPLLDNHDLFFPQRPSSIVTTPRISKSPRTLRDREGGRACGGHRLLLCARRVHVCVAVAGGARDLPRTPLWLRRKPTVTHTSHPHTSPPRDTHTPSIANATRNEITTTVCTCRCWRCREMARRSKRGKSGCIPSRWTASRARTCPATTWRGCTSVCVKQKSKLNPVDPCSLKAPGFNP